MQLCYSLKPTAWLLRLIAAAAVAAAIADKGISSAESNCTQPFVDSSRVGEYGCIQYRQICVDQGTLIFFNPIYQLENPRRMPLPSIPFAEHFNWPSLQDVNLDALKHTDRLQSQQASIPVRASSAAEPSPDLQDPSFSSCTFPLLLVSNWLYNMAEYIANTAAPLHRMREEKIVDGNVTLVVATPYGLGMRAFHHALLAPLTSRRVVSLAELGERRLGGGAAVAAAGGRCFASMLVCHLRAAEAHTVPAGQAAALHLLAATAAAVAAAAPAADGTRGAAVVDGRSSGGGGSELPPLPYNPLNFTDAALEERFAAERAAAAAVDEPQWRNATLRVVIASRRGPVRNIRTLEQLLAACEQLGRSGGFAVGRFSGGIECREHCFGPRTQPPVRWPAAGGLRRDRQAAALAALDDLAALRRSVSGEEDSARFAANVAAVRSADVLVTIHGAGAANSYFMRPGSALLELRPCHLGTRYHSWPDSYFPRAHAAGHDVVQFYALNIEDPEQCLPGDWEAALLTARGRQKEAQPPPPPEDESRALEERRLAAWRQLSEQTQDGEDRGVSEAGPEGRREGRGDAQGGYSGSVVAGAGEGMENGGGGVLQQARELQQEQQQQQRGRERRRNRQDPSEGRATADYSRHVHDADNILCRDQHLLLRWEPLEKMLRVAAGALYDREAYRRLRKEKGTYGFLLPGGLQFERPVQGGGRGKKTRKA